MEEQLEVMSNRLRNLEDKLYKKDNAGFNDNVNVDESLQGINNKINIALIGREKVKSIFKRIDEIERFLDQSLGEEMTLTDVAKLNIICSQDALIGERCEQLQQVQDLEPVLNSEHIKAATGLSGKLKALNYVHIQQEEQMANVSEDIRQLAANYNSIISKLTHQFIIWDDVVTKAEIAVAATKKKP